MRRLLVRPGAIGDCLCALPALWLLQGTYTEIWTSGAVAPLVGFGSHVRSLAGTGFDLLGIPGVDLPDGLIDHLKSFDEILSWAGWNQPLLRERMAALGLPVHFLPALPEAGELVHVSDFLLRQTSAWHGTSLEPAAWREPGGRRFLLHPVCLGGDTPGASPVVVLHPYSGSAAKNWPLESFRQLAAWCAQRAEVRWCASPEDPLPTDLAAGAWRHEGLRSLARDLSRASLYIGNDSGITHLAAMLGVPVVVFFGPMDPRQWLPRGCRVHVAQTAAVGQPAGQIGVDLALRITENAWRELALESANGVP